MQFCYDSTISRIPYMVTTTCVFFFFLLLWYRERYNHTYFWKSGCVLMYLTQVNIVNHYERMKKKMEFLFDLHLFMYVNRSLSADGLLITYTPEYY